MRPRIELAPESRAEEPRDDAHVLLRQSEHLRQNAPQVDHPLRRVIQRQHLAIPDRGGGVQLERIVRFGWRDVSFVELDGRTGEGGCGIAPVALQSLHWSISGKDDVRIVARFEAGLNIGFFFGVRRTHCIGRSLGGLESIGDGESDVLAVVSDHVIFEWGPALQADAIEARRRGGTKDPADIPAMKNRTCARHLLRCRSIEREQFAIRDRGFHRHGVQHSGEIEI